MTDSASPPKRTPSPQTSPPLAAPGYPSGMPLFPPFMYPPHLLVTKEILALNQPVFPGLCQSFWAGKESAASPFVPVTPLKGKKDTKLEKKLNKDRPTEASGFGISLAMPSF